MDIFRFKATDIAKQVTIAGWFYRHPASVKSFNESMNEKSVFQERCSGLLL